MEPAAHQANVVDRHLFIANIEEQNLQQGQGELGPEIEVLDLADLHQFIDNAAENEQGKLYL